MGRKVQLYVALLLLACLVTGCGGKDYEALVEKQAAIKNYRDGVWEVRFCNDVATDVGNIITDARTILSINVNKDMTEKEALEVLEYYEFTRCASFKNGSYAGRRDMDYTCYAVFYRGDTNQELWRKKYFNGKEVEIPEEEQQLFAMPELHLDEYKGMEMP